MAEIKQEAAQGEIPAVDPNSVQAEEQKNELEIKLDLPPPDQKDEDIEENKLSPGWINAHPEFALNSLFSDFTQLEAFLQQYGKELTCLNLQICYPYIHNSISKLEADEFETLIGYCPNLKRLVINDVKATMIHDTTFALIGKMSLAELSLYSCHFNPEGFAKLEGLPLTTIEIKGCRNLTDEMFRHFKGMKLTKVNFYACHHITDAAMEYLEGMPISDVDLSSNRQLTNQAIASLQNMPLTKINFLDAPV